MSSFVHHQSPASYPLPSTSPPLPPSSSFSPSASHRNPSDNNNDNDRSSSSALPHPIHPPMPPLVPKNSSTMPIPTKTTIIPTTLHHLPHPHVSPPPPSTATTTASLTLPFLPPICPSQPPRQSVYPSPHHYQSIRPLPPSSSHYGPHHQHTLITSSASYPVSTPTATATVLTTTNHDQNQHQLSAVTALVDLSQTPTTEDKPPMINTGEKAPVKYDNHELKTIDRNGMERQEEQQSLKNVNGTSEVSGVGKVGAETTLVLKAVEVFEESLKQLGYVVGRLVLSGEALGKNAGEGKGYNGRMTTHIGIDVEKIDQGDVVVGKKRKGNWSFERNGEKEGKFECRSCQVGFWERKMLIEHFVRVHGGNVEKVEHGQPEVVDNKNINQNHERIFLKGNGRKKIKGVCADRNMNVNDNSTAVSNNTSKESCWCVRCGASFSGMGSLLGHMASAHGVHRTHECRHCLKYFGSPNQLRDHVAAVHEKKRPFACHVCAAKFGLNHNLLRHIRTVHRDRFGGTNGTYGHLSSRSKHLEANSRKILIARGNNGTTGGNVKVLKYYA